MSRRPLVVLLAGALACGRGEQPAPSASGPLATAEGFEIPESARFDPARDVYYVSSIAGNPSVRDNNGFISRVRADGTLDALRFIAGGANGVTLHAPKGMYLAGDTLFVADIDVIRAFHAVTGAMLGVLDLAPQGAVFLNDITRANDGTLYVSDTRLIFPDSGRIREEGPYRIYRVGPDRAVSVILEGDTLARPNGVLWDEAANRLLIVSLSAGRILSWQPGAVAPVQIATGPGGYDGIEPLGDGRFLVSSQDDSTVSILGGDGSLTPVVRGLDSPADIGWDPGRRRVAVPLLGLGRVEFWAVP